MASETNCITDKGLSILPAGTGRFTFFVLLALAAALTPSPAWSQLVPGSMDVHWNEGSPDCAKNPQPPLQVHQYNARMFILRENPCTTFEAPFMYLLVGSTKALLIDTGDIADPSVVPLAETVMGLLPADGAAKLSLLVVHTHRHLDHRAGDPQFARFSNAQVVGFDIDSVRSFYKFTDWPNGLAQVDLGDRTVDVIATPGHSETEVSFYDRSTGLLFTGDFLMPARLLIDDTSADIASADRIAAFVKDRPISFVLGGHIEMNSAGELFPWESQYHPNEHALQMTKDDVLALPAAVHSFNGFYTVRGQFTMENTIRILIACAVLVLVAVIALVWALVRFIRRRRRARKLATKVQA
jgi:glyoxylase-like metal-dependent hydrolase (beta-lactamase superfamily II)